MIYFTVIFGTVFIYEASLYIAFKVDRVLLDKLDEIFSIFEIIFKLVSVIIIIITAIIVVKKLCNKTLREHDSSRASRAPDK